MTKSAEQPKRLLNGVVVSDKMEKTVVVEAERRFRHPVLGKVIRRTKKYKVHDASGLAKVGDTVEFCGGRPVSKTKHMYLVRVVAEGV